MATDNSKIQEIVLQGLAESSSFKDGAVLKGGGALRHVYGSPRFSADLDLSWPTCNLEKAEAAARQSCRLIRKVLGNEFKTDKVYHTSGNCIRAILSETLSDRSKNKVFINTDDWPNPEAATHALKVPGMPILRVRTLRQMVNDKFLAILTRRRPKGRDFFDIGFLKYREIEVDEAMRALSAFQERGYRLDLKKRFEQLKVRLAEPATRDDIQRDILDYLNPEETRAWSDAVFDDMYTRTCEWLAHNLTSFHARR